jgi:uncharacterized protein
MRYVIHAYDGTDEGALERRMAARPSHFEGAAVLKANGNLVMGGALLDPDGKMIGSMMVVDFETEQQLADWQAIEPYIQQKVWQKIDIKPFKQAQL